MKQVASHEEKPQEQVILHDGVAFHVLSAGQGPVLILLHGGGSRADYFRSLMAMLSAGHHVIAFDQRAFGRTEISPGTVVDHTNWASDVIGIMDALHIKTAVLLGWSMGASVAINAAFSWPDRVEGLILLGGPDPDHGVNVARLRERQTEAAGLDPAQIRARDRLEISAHVGSAARTCPPLIERLVEDRAATPPARAALAIGGYATRPDLTTRLPAIACPVTIIGGDEDGISTPEVTARLAAYLPQARVEILNGCGHYHVAEQPDAVARIISAELGAMQG